MAQRTSGTKHTEIKTQIEAELSIVIDNWGFETYEGAGTNFYILAPSLTPGQGNQLNAWRNTNYPNLYLEWDEA